MPPPQDYLKDPDFFAADRETKRAVLRRLDSDFAQVDEATQNLVLDKYEGRTPPVPRPTEGVFAPGRYDVRKSVEALPTPARLAVEGFPSILGSILYPPAGGLVGEKAAQFSGLAPESLGTLAVSAIPFGVVINRGIQAAKAATRAAPGVRPAVAAVKSERALTELDTLLGRLKPSPPASELYETLGKAGVRLRPTQFPQTRQALDDVQREVLKFSGTTPEGLQLLGSIKRAREVLRDEPLDFEFISKLHSSLGHQVKKLEKAAGVRLGEAKVLRGAMTEDLKTLAQTGPPRVASGAALTLRATETAKREFALKKVEALTADSLMPIPGTAGEFVFNAQAVLQQLSKVTNPASKAFDKNLVAGLGNDLPDLQAFLTRVAVQQERAGFGPAALASAGLAAQLGRGAGKLAGATVFGGGPGALAGGAMFGLPGAAVGGAIGTIAGLRAPQAITHALLSPKGRVVLERLLQEGRGTLNDRTIQALAQSLRSGARSLQE